MVAEAEVDLILEAGVICGCATPLWSPLGLLEHFRDLKKAKRSMVQLFYSPIEYRVFLAFLLLVDHQDTISTAPASDPPAQLHRLRRSRHSHPHTPSGSWLRWHAMQYRSPPTGNTYKLYSALRANIVVQLM
jgi:hypothetical protein